MLTEYDPVRALSYKDLVIFVDGGHYRFHVYALTNVAGTITEFVNTLSMNIVTVYSDICYGCRA